MDLTPITQALAGDGIALVRTDFTDDAVWQGVVDRAHEPSPEEDEDEDDAYHPGFEVVDDRSLDGVTGAALGQACSEAGVAPGFVVLVDARSVSEAAGGDLTLEWVDLSVGSPEDAELFDSHLGRTFRSAITEVASIEANLSLSNVDFSDFANDVGADGVYRGTEE